MSPDTREPADDEILDYAKAFKLDLASYSRGFRTRTFWLSFCDTDKPTGEQFLGVVMVDVTFDDAAEALLLIDEMFPQHADEAEWVAAATRKAHRLGINPGGQIMSIDITGAPAPPGLTLPKDRLLSYADLEAAGLRPKRIDD